jgi:hypothetical protein
MPRNFEGYDEPVNIEGDPEDVLKVLLTEDPTQITDVADEDTED